MKKIIVSLAVLLGPALAQADIIKCTFTEPFIGTHYSMTQSKLTIENFGEDTKVVIRNVSFQILGPGQFELWDKHNQVILKMDLNYQGSDGMSDKVFPYEATLDGQLGGCTSQFLPATGS